MRKFLFIVGFLVVPMLACALGIKKTITGLSTGISYTISATIDDSIGTNDYSIVVMDQADKIALSSTKVKRGKHSLNFSLPTGTTTHPFLYYCHQQYNLSQSAA